MMMMIINLSSLCGQEMDKPNYADMLPAQPAVPDPRRAAPRMWVQGSHATHNVLLTKRFGGMDGRREGISMYF
jgi:hypothetical protein